VDDVLKSMVVRADGGRVVAAATYPTELPVAKALAGFEVDLSKDFSLPGFLKQLRGRRVVVSVGAEQVAGKVLGLDRRRRGGREAAGGQVRFRGGRPDRGAAVVRLVWGAGGVVPVHDRGRHDPAARVGDDPDRDRRDRRGAAVGL
jgi:hypothetical protein